MAHLLRLILLCVVVGAPGVASALPMIVGQWRVSSGNASTPDATGGSAELACLAHVAAANGRDAPAYTYTYASVSVAEGASTGTCNFTFKMQGSATVFQSNRPMSAFSACPADSTQVGQQCQCNAGLVEAAGKCTTPGQAGHVDYCNQNGPGKNEAMRVRASGIRESDGAFCEVPFYSVPGLGPTMGCVAFAGSGVKYTDDDGVEWFRGTSTGSSTTCNGSLTSSEPQGGADTKPDTCPGGYPGQVNGVEVCVPHSGQGKITSTDTTKTTNADGTTTETTKEVKCEGGKCTTTETTTTKDSNGNTTGSGTKKTEDTVAGTCAKNPGTTVCSAVGKEQGVLDGLRAFCKENPSIGMCKKASGSGNGSGSGDGDGEEGESSFGGNCESGFVAVSDDAVLNAMAKEQHVRNCKFFDKVPDATADTNDADDMRAKGKEGRDQTQDLPEHLKRSQSFGPGDIQTNSLINASQCIPDMTIDVIGNSVTLPFSKLCAWLGYMGTILVACAYIVAARIVLGHA